MSDPVIKDTADLVVAIKKISFINTVLDFKWQFEFEPATIRTSKEVFKAWLVWVTFERPDTITGEIGRGQGRKEIIWAGSSESSAVKTFWLLVELMVRHELMEGFCYENERIFNPHNSVLDLLKLQREHAIQNDLPKRE